VVCFPHAGGDAPVYSALGQALPHDIEVLAVRMPRPGEPGPWPVPEDLAAFTGLLAAALARVPPPYLMLGQSLGALLAFETVRAATTTPPVGCLFLSAAPPDHWQGLRELYAASGPEVDRVLLSYLRTGDAEWDRAVADPAVAALVLRDTRADLRLLRGYAASPDPPLDCPVHLLVGERDPGLRVEDMAGWNRYTSRPCSVRSLPVGHFIVQQAQTPLVQEIIRVAAVNLSAEGE
jgi:pyochelin biosynthesis protein PchC